MFLWLGMAIFVSVNVRGQGTTGTSANVALAQLAAAFSSGQAVHQVQLTGTANWYAGSLQDSGSVSLTASTSGSSQLQLQLSSVGTKSETQSGSGESTTCQWAGKDGVAHTVDLGNCWRPELWFLPALSLQPSLLPRYLAIVDLGTGTVGAGVGTYRHLQSESIFTDLSTTFATNIAQQTLTDLGLDPTSMLPAVLAYLVRPDNGAQTPVAIEIHYSNYQTVNGVQLPFLIQRYVNGSLQLSIVVSTAQTS